MYLVNCDMYIYLFIYQPPTDAIRSVLWIYAAIVTAV